MLLCVQLRFSVCMCVPMCAWPGMLTESEVARRVEEAVAAVRAEAAASVAAARAEANNGEGLWASTSEYKIIHPGLLGGPHRSCIRCRICLYGIWYGTVHMVRHIA